MTPVVNANPTPTAPGLPHSGRLLAIDLGEKRIGLALSDPTQRLSRPLRVIKRRSRREDFARLQQYVVEEAVVGVVVGVPLNEGSGSSSTERWVRDYAADLTGHLPVPLALADESFSTAEARASLQARGRRGRRVRDEIDAVAAAFILQRYLDARALERSDHEDTAS